MEISSIKAFFGVPVVVQLKFPIAQVRVQGKSAIPYATDPEKQWIPEEMISKDSFPLVTEVVRYAVLRQLSESGTLIEMVWSTIGPIEPGAAVPVTVTIATLIDSQNIAAVTRVVEVPEPKPAPLILSAR